MPLSLLVDILSIYGKLVVSVDFSEVINKLKDDDGLFKLPRKNL